MAGEDVAKIAVLMAALPGEVNLYEATMLPNDMRRFIGRARGWQFAAGPPLAIVPSPSRGELSRPDA